MAANFCTNCGSKNLETQETGVFVELGEYDGKAYESEGNATAVKCLDCGEVFFVDGPDLPAVAGEAETQEAGEGT